MDKIIKINIKDSYSCEILGLGEVFEIISIERRRKKLLKKYRKGYLYLCSNKSHSGKGVVKEELEGMLQNDGLGLLESGYADAPPWKSNPAAKGKETLKYKIPGFSFVCKILFRIWIPFFERFFQRRTIAHVVWALGKL